MTHNNLLTGANYLLEGFKLLLKPGLKRFVIIPLLINIIVFVGLFFLSYHFFGELNHWLESHLPHWLRWLGVILWGIFFLGFALVMIYTFVTVANIVAAPFNSFLAEKVQLYLTGKIHEQSFWAICKDIPRIVGRQFAILGYYLPRAIALLILFFIPIIQIVAAFFWFLFNAWFMTLQYVDYPTDNLHIELKTVRTRMTEKRWLSLGFGIGVLLFAMIPVLNFFVIPAAVAGATKLWVKEYSSEQ